MHTASGSTTDTCAPTDFPDGSERPLSRIFSTLYTKAPNRPKCRRPFGAACALQPATGRSDPPLTANHSCDCVPSAKNQVLGPETIGSRIGWHAPATTRSPKSPPNPWPRRSRRIKRLRREVGCQVMLVHVIDCLKRDATVTVSYFRSTFY